MPATPRPHVLRRNVLATLTSIAVGASSLLLSAPAGAAHFPAADDSVVKAAASYLAGTLNDAGLVTIGGGSVTPDGVIIDQHESPDYGRSLDAALALLAAGTEDNVLRRTLTSVEDSRAVTGYTGAGVGGFGAAAVVAAAKLALVVDLTGGDPTSVGGVDLLAYLLSLAQPDGRFDERSDFGNYPTMYGHAFALLALDTAGRTPAEPLVQALLDAQCADGSFPETYEPIDGSVCTGGLEITGLVLQALAALDRAGDRPATEAVAWLLPQQQPDGGFGTADSDGFIRVSRGQVTGAAVLGLNAVGRSNAAAVAWLATQQNPDGGLDDSAEVFSNQGVTLAALPALAGTTFQHSARVVARLAVPVPPNTLVTPSPTPTPTPTPVPPRTPEEPDNQLPVTGVDSTDVLIMGLSLVAAGAVLLLAARPPRRGRHAANLMAVPGPRRSAGDRRATRVAGPTATT